jgi:hypothetical protein
MNNIDTVVGSKAPGAGLTGAKANVAGETVVISRKEVTKEITFKKFIAMLATTVLTIKTTAREDLDAGQVFVGDVNPGNIISPNQNRLSAVVRNIGGQNAFIGSYGVTITTGFLLRPFESIVLDKTWGAIYGISDNANGTTICFIEE